jgi:hypothetical protein
MDDGDAQQKSKSLRFFYLPLQYFFHMAAIWSVGILSAHIVAIWTGKEEVLKEILNAYLDALIRILTHIGTVCSMFSLNISDNIVQVLKFLGEATVAVVDYAGYLIASTLRFAGIAFSETTTFLGLVISSSFNFSGSILYSSLNYVGLVISGSMFFVLDVMEKIASLKVLYSFLFLLSLYVVRVHPDAVRRSIGEIFAPIKNSISEVWYSFTRAVHLVWSSTNLVEVIKVLVIAVLLLHLKNNFLYQ